MARPLTTGPLPEAHPPRHATDMWSKVVDFLTDLAARFMDFMNKVIEWFAEFGAAIASWWKSLW
ncbi:hypothetical protein GCM10017688_41480 [Streptomyces ramulosus]